jgi:hypothetical protein
MSGAIDLSRLLGSALRWHACDFNGTLIGRSGNLRMAPGESRAKKETKRPTQESLGSGKSITFMGIVVIWGNAFTRILRFFRREVAKNVKVFATSPNYSGWNWSCVATVDFNG